MAQLAYRTPENIPGAFYVDDTCIDCDMCRNIAPSVFRRNDADARTYVYHQPETEEEQALAKEALECCPTETIGDDGEG